MSTEQAQLAENHSVPASGMIDPGTEVPAKSGRFSRNRLSVWLMYPVSALVALPTGILSGFAALEGGSGNLGSLNSLQAIGELIAKQTPGHFLYGLICLLATAIVLTGLNTKYLASATQSVLSLIRTNCNGLKARFTATLPTGKKISWIENGLFIWCFMTSLIFAELGRETLAFAGKWGELTGFYLNLIVYFSTRFSGAQRFFHSAIRTHRRDAMTFAISPAHTPSAAEKALTMVGYSLAFISAAPIIINFIPECVHGLQTLLHSSLNADPACQNMSAVTIGVIATLPTVFFYSVSIKDLPHHLARTVAAFHLRLKVRQYQNCLSMVCLTLLAFAASYFAGIGFRLVGTSNLVQGYLSWMNPILAGWMPNALFIAGLMMFWSHLQYLVNGRFSA